MIQEKGQRGVLQIRDQSILEYARSLPDGMHYAMIPSNTDITITDAPTTGRGFVVEIFKVSNVIRLQASQFNTSRYIYQRLFYNTTWYDWQVFTGVPIETM